ncbi:MAG: hypothetical protein ACSHXB_00680 [Sulfitobacter sp.]
MKRWKITLPPNAKAPYPSAMIIQTDDGYLGGFGHEQMPYSSESLETVLKTMRFDAPDLPILKHWEESKI